MDGGCREVLVFMVSMEHDGSNILENKQAVAESHTLSLALLHTVRVIHSITCARVCKRAHTQTHTHSPLSDTLAAQTLPPKL